MYALRKPPRTISRRLTTPTSAPVSAAHTNQATWVGRRKRFRYARNAIGVAGADTQAPCRRRLRRTAARNSAWRRVEGFSSRTREGGATRDERGLLRTARDVAATGV